MQIARHTRDSSISCQRPRQQQQEGMAGQCTQKVGDTAKEKNWHLPLQLDNIELREKDVAHSHDGILRHKALWINSPVTVTKLPIGRDLQETAESLQSLRHPNILQFWGVVCMTKEPQLPRIVTEPLNESLAELLKRLPELSFHTRVAGLVQIAGGLQYLHFRGFLHRNLNPQHVFVAADGIVMKIGYFGGGKGSLEQSGDEGTVKEVSQDVHSFGVLIQKAFGDPENKDQLYPKIKACGCPNDEKGQMIVSIVKKCQLKDFSRRLSAKSIVERFSRVMEGIPTPTDDQTSKQKDFKNLQTQKIGRLESELESTTKTLEDRDAQIAKKERELSDKKREIGQKEKAADELSKKMKNLDQEIGQEALAHRKTLQEKKDKERKIDELERNGKQLREEIDELKESLGTAKDTISQRNKTIADMEDSLCTKQNELNRREKLLKKVGDFLNEDDLLQKSLKTILRRSSQQSMPTTPLSAINQGETSSNGAKTASSTGHHKGRERMAPAVLHEGAVRKSTTADHSPGAPSQGVTGSNSAKKASTTVNDKSSKELAPQAPCKGVIGSDSVAMKKSTTVHKDNKSMAAGDPHQGVTSSNSVTKPSTTGHYKDGRSMAPSASLQGVTSIDSATKPSAAGHYKDSKDDPFFLCSSCSTPILDKTVHCLRSSQTTAVHILSDHQGQSENVKRMIEDIFKQGKQKIPIKRILYSQFKTTKQEIEDTCLVLVSVKEGHTINDTNDPFTGFLKHIEGLRKENIILIAFWAHDAGANQNYHSRVINLREESPKGNVLKTLAESGRFYSVSKSLNRWQTLSLAAALGVSLAPKKSFFEERQKGKDDGGCIIS